MIERCRPRPVMHREYADQQPYVASAVDAEHAKTVFDRRRPQLKKADQQNRCDPHDFPSRRQQIERAGGKRQQRSEREKMQQKEKPQESRLSMEVTDRKSTRLNSS